MKKIILFSGILILFQANTGFSRIEFGLSGGINAPVLLQADVSSENSAQQNPPELDFDSAIKILNNTADNLDLAARAIKAVDYLSQNLESFSAEEIEQVNVAIVNIEGALGNAKGLGGMDDVLYDLWDKIDNLSKQIQSLPKSEPKKPDLNKLGNEELIKMLGNSTEEQEMKDVIRILKDRDKQNQLTSDTKVTLFEVLANREIKLGDDYRDFVIELAKQYTLQAIAKEPVLEQREDLIEKVLSRVGKILGEVDDDILAGILTQAGLRTAQEFIVHHKVSEKIVEEIRKVATAVLYNNNYTPEQKLDAISCMVEIALKDNSQAGEKARDFLKNYASKILFSEDLNLVKPVKIFLALTALQMLEIRLERKGGEYSKKVNAQFKKIFAHLQDKIFDSESGYDNIKYLFSLVRDLQVKNHWQKKYLIAEAVTLVYAELLPYTKQFYGDNNLTSDSPQNNKNGDVRKILKDTTKRLFLIPLATSVSSDGDNNLQDSNKKGFLQKLGKIISKKWTSQTAKDVGKILAELYESSPETAILAGEALGIASSSMSALQRVSFINDLSQGISGYVLGRDSVSASSKTPPLSLSHVVSGKEVNALSVLEALTAAIYSGIWTQGLSPNPNHNPILNPLSHLRSGTERKSRSFSTSSTPGITGVSFIPLPYQENDRTQSGYGIENMNPEYQKLVQKIRKNPQLMALIRRKYPGIADMMASLNLSNPEVGINLLSLSLTHFNLMGYYSTLLAQNSLYYFIQVLFKDLSKIGNLKEVFPDNYKFFDFFSPRMIIKEILKKIASRKTEERAKFRITFPTRIPLGQFLLMFASLLIFSACFGYSAGKYYLKSREENKERVRPAW